MPVADVVLDDLLVPGRRRPGAGRRRRADDDRAWRSTSRCSPARPSRWPSSRGDAGLVGRDRGRRAAAGSRRRRSARTPTPPGWPTEARRFTTTYSELVAGTNRLLRWIARGARRRRPGWCCGASSARTDNDGLAGRGHRHGRGAGRHGARGPGAADDARLRGRDGDAWPAGRSWCRSCPRSRAWPASTWSAWTRPARSPTATSGSTGSCRSTASDGRPARAALGAARRRRPGRTPRAAALAAAFPPPDGRRSRRTRAVLLGPQVVGGPRPRPGPPGCSGRRRWCCPAVAGGAGRRPRARRRARRARAGGCCCWRGRPPRRDDADGDAVLPAGARRRSRSSCWPSGSARTPPRRSRYFTDQGVALKVISGDNPRTVGAVAAAVGRARRDGADDAVDARDPARGPRRAGRGDGGRQRVRAGHPAPEAGDGAGAAAPRARGGDDRRRRERRARAQGRRHRRRHGQRLGGDPGGGPARAARRPVRAPAAGGRRGPAGDRQHRAGGQPVPGQERLLAGAGAS